MIIAPFFLSIPPRQIEKLIVKDVVVLIDREQGGPEHLKANGLNLHSAFTLSELLKVWGWSRVDDELN